MTQHTKESIHAMLDRSNEAVARAVVAIWRRQTASEQASRETVEHNGVGFASCDSRRGSYYADWILRGRQLSGKHLAAARKMAKKYHRQLCEIANSRAPAPQSAVTIHPAPESFAQRQQVGDWA